MTLFPGLLTVTETFFSYRERDEEVSFVFVIMWKE